MTCRPRKGPFPRGFPANASATTRRWYVKNPPAARNVTSAALRRTKLVSGSAIATNAPVSNTVKMGRRSIRMPRTHRPWYIWPRPGRSNERIAANPGEPLPDGAESERTGGNAADAAPRFDTEPLAYETRRPEDGAPASGRLRDAARRSRRGNRLRHPFRPPGGAVNRVPLGVPLPALQPDLRTDDRGRPAGVRPWPPARASGSSPSRGRLRGRGACDGDSRGCGVVR